MPLYDIIKPFNTPLEEFEGNDKGLFNKVKIIINGNWIGVAKDPVKTYEFLKEKKYQGIINIYTSIIFNYKRKFIWVCNDAGRLTRPVFKVNNHKLLLTRKMIKDIKTNNFKWDDLLVNHKYKNSLIEYIDPEEQNCSLIAMTPKSINEEKSFTINIRIVKFIHLQYLEYWRVVFHFLNTINHQEILISVLWVSKLWVCLLQTTRLEWIKRRMFKHIRVDHS